MLHSFAIPDYSERLQKGLPNVSDEVFETWARAPLAERFARVYRAMPISDLPGTPTVGELSGKNIGWIELAFRCLAGSLDEETGVRGVNQLVVLAPKKNGKSFSSALAMLALMLVTKRPGSNFPILSPTLEISNLSFRAAADAALMQDDIAPLIKSQDHIRRLTNLRTNSTLRIVSATPRSVTGMRAHVSLVDEIHTLAAGSADADRTWAQVAGAGAADPGAATVVITTMSERPPVGVFRDLLTRARGIRDGVIKDHGGLLPILYEPWDGADLEDRKIWQAVNPSMGLTVTLPKLENLHAAAVSAGPAALQIFRSQHLNAEPKISALGDTWKAAQLWADATDPMVAEIGREETLRRKIADADVVAVGVDAGGLWDSSAVAIICRSALTGDLYIDGNGYVTRQAVEATNAGGVWLKDQTAQGDLMEIEAGGDVVDIGARVAEIVETGTEVMAGLDPWQVTDVQAELVAIGVPEENIVGVRQGVGLSSAIDQLERSLGSNKISHSGSPYLTACLSNVVIIERGQARAIEKVEPTRKIDGAAAILSGLFVVVHGADEDGVEGIDPWTDPHAAAAVWNGDSPISSYPPADGVDFVAIA